MLKPAPINVAEAIIEPFWTPDLSGLAKWRVEPGSGHGLRIRQNWSAVDFEWASKPQVGPALRMTRDFGVDCSAYDCLLVALSLPKGCVLRVTAQTDKGQRSFVSEPAVERQAECAVELNGAAQIDSLTLEIEAAGEGNAAGWLRWIGLQNTKLLPQYFAQWDYSGRRWDAYIRGDGFTPGFTLRYGIFMTAQELEQLRDEHRQAVEKDGRSRYTSLAAAAREYEPERGIHEFAKSGGSTSAHTRVRDEVQSKLTGSTDLAVAGLVLRDEYELGKGTGVEFYWQTKLPVERQGQTVTIRGAQCIVSVTAPPDCTIHIEELPLAEGDKHNRIAIRKEATQGTLEVTVELRRGILSAPCARSFPVILNGT